MSARVICRGCKKEFVAKRIDRQWCDECRVKNRERHCKEYEWKKKVKCIDCGTLIGRGAQRCRVCDNKARTIYFKREANPNWRGGSTYTREGYIYKRVEYRTNGKHPYRGEHILVWEEQHGQPLPQGWVVHHLNGIKDDNRPENLLGLPRGEHHKHPFEVIKVYQDKIRELEEKLRVKNNTKHMIVIEEDHNNDS